MYLIISLWNNRKNKSFLNKYQKKKNGVTIKRFLINSVFFLENPFREAFSVTLVLKIIHKLFKQ